MTRKTLGYTYKNTVLGKEIITTLQEMGEGYISLEDAIEVAKILEKNCVISKVPYSPMSEIEFNEDFYCFVVRN
jgi:hypothetical protein